MTSKRNALLGRPAPDPRALARDDFCYYNFVVGFDTVEPPSVEPRFFRLYHQ